MTSAPFACAVGRSVGHFHAGWSDTGVVVCAPLGFENLTTRLGMRLLAVRLSEAGLHTLRFDYHGEGDAPGSDTDAERWDAWVQSTRDAVAWMRRRPNIRRVVVIGVRLGALVAVHALAGDAPVDELVLLSPVFDGRTYCREMQALAAVTSTQRPSADMPVDTMGFRLDSRTMEDLRRIRIETAGRVAERLLCLTGAPDVTTRHRAALEALCDTQKILPYEGEAKFLNDPLLSCPPDAAFESIVAHLSSGITLTQNADSGALHPAIVANRHFRERAVRFGDGNLLAGVLCRPIAPTRHRLAVLFLNNGRTCHIGPGRSSVEQARALASCGIASLRFDVAGLGESPAKTGRTEIVAYDAALVEDVSRAVDHLAEAGYSRFLLVGLCSGANLAFHAALADERIEGVFLANLVRFHFHPDSIDAIVEVGWRSRPHYYRDEIFKPAFWRALAAGQIAVGHKIAAASRVLHRKLRDVASNAGLGPRGCELVKIRGAFEDLARRRVDVTLAYAEGDAALVELERHMGKDGRRLRRYDTMRKIVLPQADHLFLAGDSRSQFRDAILRFSLSHAGSPLRRTRRMPVRLPPRGVSTLPGDGATLRSPDEARRSG